jgi:hypothetical protein
MKNIVTKSYSISDVNGFKLRIGETENRLLVSVSIEHASGENSLSVFLDRDQFNAFGKLFDKYGSDRLEICYPELEEDTELKEIKPEGMQASQEGN